MAANPRDRVNTSPWSSGVSRQNRVVHRAAVIVAVAIAVAGPAIFATVGYVDVLNLRRFQADITAGQVARYAYIQGPTWGFSDNRVAELVRQTAPIDDAGRRIIAPFQGGAPIVVGDEPAAPVARVSVPIVAGAERVGTVTVEASLWPLLFDVALAVAVALVLAIAAYACVRFPLARLRRVFEGFRESEARFRSLAAVAPMAISILDLHGRVQWANNEMLRRLDVPLDALKGKSPHDIYAKEIADDIVRLDGLVLARREPQIAELDVGTSDGDARPEIHVRFPIEDEGGNLIGLGSTALDISARRTAEDRLRQALRLQAVGRLSGGVSHDFNNLLQAIETNLALAKLAVEGNAHATGLIDAALQAGRRGADLTMKLLAFSRQQTLRPRRLDINAWLREETALLARTLGGGIAIRAEPCADAVEVLVDEGSLANALLNLAHNAREAMPAGGVIAVSAQRRRLLPDDDDTLPAGDYVEIAMADTGIGMAREVLSRAFEPFFTTKEVGQGSGLGLSMVYGFARQSGGTATIESAPGKGTTVRILLPAAQPGAAASTG